MPKITPFLEEVVYLVADFLASIQHPKQAQKLKKEFQLPQWVKKDNPLIKKGLTKALKQYINENEKVLKYYKNRKPESEDEQSEEQEQAPKPTKKSRKSVSPKHSPLAKPKSPKISTTVYEPAPTKGWMASQFQQPKRLEDLNDDDQQPQKKQQPEVVIPKKDKKAKKQIKKKQSSSEASESEQQTPKPKKKKKQIKKQKKQSKIKGPVDSSYLNSEEQFQLEDKKSKKSVTPQKIEPKKSKPEVKEPNKVEAPKQKNYQTQNQQSQQSIEMNGKNNGPKKFFSRINEQQVGHIPQNRRDNTFEAKARYGAGDAWGQFGHEKLKDTRGDSFKKTKGKLKNKAFQGLGININQINSVPII